VSLARTLGEGKFIPVVALADNAKSRPVISRDVDLVLLRTQNVH
jgi:hypothetical protein